MDFVKRVEEAVENVLRLNAFLAEHPQELNSSIAQVRHWYAVWIDGEWQYGFSKFIGYANMTPEVYATKRRDLSGSETERDPQFNSMSMIVEKDAPLYAVLSKKLRSFLNDLGREAPRPDSSIHVLLTPPLAPPPFVIREECEKAAWQNGFRRACDSMPGWAGFSSTTVPGTIHLAAASPQGPWYLALDHQGVIDELALPASALSGPGLWRHAFSTLRELYRVLSRVYQLSASLPDAPLALFKAKVKTLPQTTEAERLVVQRIGQEIFRASLLEYWQGRCPLTGISDAALLRASHIIPWKDCASDEERLDVHNGLLLSALWDAAFDRGLVTFGDDGHPIYAPELSEAARGQLQWQAPVSLTDRHRARLAFHRASVFRSGTV